MKNKTKKPSKKLEATKRIYPIEHVFWNDHYTGQKNWTDAEHLDRKGPLVCTSVGMRIFEDKETLVLAQNMGENATCADTVTILKNCIKTRKIIGEVSYDNPKG